MKNYSEKWLEFKTHEPAIISQESLDNLRERRIRETETILGELIKKLDESLT